MAVTRIRAYLRRYRYTVRQTGGNTREGRTQMDDENIEYTDVHVAAAATAYIKTPGVRISPRAADAAMRRGEITYFKIGRARFTTVDAIAEWVERCKVEPRTPHAQAV